MCALSSVSSKLDHVVNITCVLSRDHDFCRAIYDTCTYLRPTIIVPENKNRIFQHFGRVFLPGTLKNIPCSLDALLVNFREESSGIGRFCRLEFQRMANWPTVSIKKSKLGITKQAACFVQFTQFRSKNRNWVGWPSVGTSSLQNRPISLDSSRKLTNSSLKEQGTFFNISGRKSMPKCCFLER